ncbi:uncharacterized protein LOC113147589 [Cyclospora cayetanensis]|uniref:Uncharacterized protein LOC113147589 n=1 Tax=Cyclospora cayetanensis TaxID=88456 RepID=A0A6P6S3Y3_9EIME|nr:uncharacterized protein LOC113147589 [Cyclospora cayetanensis]
MAFPRRGPSLRLLDGRNQQCLLLPHRKALLGGRPHSRGLVAPPKLLRAHRTDLTIRRSWVLPASAASPAEPSSSGSSEGPALCSRRFFVCASPAQSCEIPPEESSPGTPGGGHSDSASAPSACAGPAPDPGPCRDAAAWAAPPPRRGRGGVSFGSAATAGCGKTERSPAAASRNSGSPAAGSRPAFVSAAGRARVACKKSAAAGGRGPVGDADGHAPAALADSGLHMRPLGSSGLIPSRSLAHPRCTDAHAAVGAAVDAAGGKSAAEFVPAGGAAEDALSDQAAICAETPEADAWKTRYALHAVGVSLLSSSLVSLSAAANQLAPRSCKASARLIALLEALAIHRASAFNAPQTVSLVNSATRAACTEGAYFGSLTKAFEMQHAPRGGRV